MEFCGAGPSPAEPRQCLRQYRDAAPLINSLFQLKPEGAGRELARFFLNISMGVGGFFDVATELGVSPSDEDFGQTLGRYGVGPGLF